VPLLPALWGHTEGCGRCAVVLHIWTTGTSGQRLREGRSSVGGGKQDGQGEQLGRVRDGPALRLLVTPRSDAAKLPLGGKQAFQEKSVTLGWTFL